ncbi:MAG: hypothetical protein JW714_05060 [Candidatus Omnitrophica bacterium]|nr:hypothetical protein [Candidatus Omnitrophota bacterium]
MIVPMKKITVLVQAKDSSQAVQELRALGIVHVTHQRPPEGKDLSAIEEDLALVEQVLAIFAREEFCQPAEQLKLPDWKTSGRHILDLANRLKQLEDFAFSLNERIGQYRPWGDFDPEAISALINQGIYLSLYRIPIQELKKLPAAAIVKVISRARGIAYCLLIARQKIKLPFNPVAWPKMGLTAMQARLAQDNQAIAALKQEICQTAAYQAGFIRIKQLLEEELQFQQAKSGMGEAQQLAYLRGYIPKDQVRSLEQTAKQKSWALLVQEPAAEDNVPTLIRNPRWVEMIRPVFRLIEVVPGYRELDISLWFLIFFSIFFGMLIGDAGLGLIFCLLTFFAQRKWGRRTKDQSLFTLLYLSSSCAIIWGVLSGTFFGQEWLPASVKPLFPALRSDKNIQALCFFLGALHLSIAHSWRALLKLPSLAALAEAGWILILWGGFFLAKMLVLADAFPQNAKWLFIAGATGVVLFANPKKNFFSGLGQGMASLLLNLINSFTDIVSYVRLFAVGLATVAVADAFNKMAMDIGWGSLTGAITSSLILLLGHTLNLLLAPMSILVHGVRLNVLEFCNHADVKWSGFAYNPLRKKS